MRIWVIGSNFLGVWGINPAKTVRGKKARPIKKPAVNKEASLESRCFPRCRYLLIKVEQTRRKDARASQEAYLMPPKTLAYKM